MATAGSKEKLLGVFVDDFTCGICLEIYESKKRKPKVLPCAHSICYTCLVGCAKHNAEREFEHAYNNADRRFRCPFCNQKIILQSTDVDKFPNNVDKMQMMEKIVGLAKNNVFNESIGLATQDISQQSDIRTCEKHGYEGSHVCETCDAFLCGQCMYLSITSGEHANHEVGLIDDSLNAQMKMLMKSQELIDEARQMIIKHEAEADENLEHDIAKAKSELCRRATELHQQIDNWQTENSVELDKALSEKKQLSKCGQDLQLTLDHVDEKLRKEAAEIEGKSKFKETSRLLKVTENIKEAIENYKPREMKVHLPDSPKLTLRRIRIGKENSSKRQTPEELCKHVEKLWLRESQGEQASSEVAEESPGDESSFSKATLRAATAKTESESEVRVKINWPVALWWVAGLVVLLVAIALIFISPPFLPIQWQKAHMVPGARVTKGPNWPSFWVDHGSVGTVVQVDVIWVQWEKTGKINYYPMRPGDYCLRLV